MPAAAAGVADNAFATALNHPRWVSGLPNGDLLVAETNAPPKPEDNKGIKGAIMKKVQGRAGAGTPSANRIILLRDADGDGVAETKTVFIANLHSPFGMALVGKDLHVANTDAVLRFPYTAGQTQISAKGVQLTDLPGGPINHHWTKNIIASPDGTKLYATAGSNSNVAENGMPAEVGRAAIHEIDLATGKKQPPGIGADWWLLGIGFIEISAIAGAIELIVGILFIRAPGMTLMRMPVFAWAMLVVAFMIVFAFPAVIAGTTLLELERAFDWPFFIAARGGDPVLWQHQFWFFGHPEVYIIFLPAASLVSMMIPTLARTPLAGCRAVVAALIAVGVISFALWAHHMFTARLGSLQVLLVSAASLIVVGPTSVQVFAWIATLWRGRWPALRRIGVGLRDIVGRCRCRDGPGPTVEAGRCAHPPDGCRGHRLVAGRRGLGIRPVRSCQRWTRAARQCLERDGCGTAVVANPPWRRRRCDGHLPAGPPVERPADADEPGNAGQHRIVLALHGAAGRADRGGRSMAAPRDGMSARG